MRPRRILSGEESSEILENAVRDSALAVLSIQEDEGWITFKSRFLERDPNRGFFVLDYQQTHGADPPPLSSGQYVGVSFRNKSRKVMFATVVEARGRYALDSSNAVMAVRYRWPETMTELQRRAYHRTPVPSGTALAASMWAGGAGARHDAQTRTLGVLTGEGLDLSCGGTLISIEPTDTPDWAEGQTLGLELRLPDGRAPLLVDAYYRGVRHEDKGGLCVAVQFVGLELSPDGRNILQRLARCVQGFHRAAYTSELSQGSRRLENN